MRSRMRLGPMSGGDGRTSECQSGIFLGGIAKSVEERRCFDGYLSEIFQSVCLSGMEIAGSTCIGKIGRLGRLVGWLGGRRKNQTTPSSGWGKNATWRGFALVLPMLQ